MKANNVVTFPGSKPIDVVEPAVDDEPAITREEIEATVNRLMENILIELREEGFHPRHLEVIKEFAFVLESIRSFVYKSHDLNHPFQGLADQIFVEKTYTKH